MESGFSTKLFLQKLAGDSSISGDDLFHELVRVLTVDGFSCFGDNNHYDNEVYSSGFMETTTGRSLSSSELDKPGSSKFAVDIILVAVCVACAAGASGLTQVFLTRHSKYYLLT